MTAASARASGQPHTHSDKLEDQAATAALYVTNIRGTSKPILDENNKLSSAGAASSLKYAQAADLPSYPTSGLKLSSAGAAASLANANQKSFEHWKPEPIPNANRAANLAKDYQMDPLWQPEASSAGSRAAILAHRDGAGVKMWKPEESAYGQSAAGQAMRNSGLSPTVERGVSKEAGNRALLAATGAMAGGRKRSDSAPAPPVGISPYALSAATSSNRAPKKSGLSTEVSEPSNDASRIHNIAKNNVNRELYGSRPPVAIEIEEKRRQDTLRAAAVSMAKQMYNIQQNLIDEAAGVPKSDSHYAANKVHRRSSVASVATTGEEFRPYPQYANLQEAARKLAGERLAKLEDENQNYKKYYGQNQQPSRSRLSMRLRRRASSDGEADVDAAQSRKIRSQMSMFQNDLAQVDEKKRQQDRAALLAAAQRKVKSSMHDMDEKVFQETGKSSPAMRQEWEVKAREKAQKESEERMANHGKVHIGGGKYLDQAEVDEIARARIQPTLDHINDRAEKLHAQQEEARLDEEERKRQAATEKVRAAELKADQKRAKELEKKDEKFRKEMEKAKKAEEKKAQPESKKQQPEPVGAIAKEQETALQDADDDSSDQPIAGETTESASPRKSKGWLSRFSRGGSKPANEVSDEAAPAKSGKLGKRENRKSFFGSSKDKEQPPKDLAGKTTTDAAIDTDSDSSLDSDEGEDSLREVALAGKTRQKPADDDSVYTTDEPEASSSTPAPVAAGLSRTSSNVSSLSSSDVAEEQAAKDRGRKRLSLKERIFKHTRGASKTQNEDSTQADVKGKGKERAPTDVETYGATGADISKHNSRADDSDDDFEEARDTFETEPMTLGAALSRDQAAAAAQKSVSPHRDSKFSEIL